MCWTGCAAGHGAELLGGLLFGVVHRRANASGALVFYELRGFTPAEAAAPGMKGGSHQIYRKTAA